MKHTVTHDDVFKQDSTSALGTTQKAGYQILCRDTLGTISAGNTLAVISIRITQYCRFEQQEEQVGS
jgi:hypothetical protein